jgi:hypothetical protein
VSAAVCDSTGLEMAADRTHAVFVGVAGSAGLVTFVLVNGRTSSLSAAARSSQSAIVWVTTDPPSAELPLLPELPPLASPWPPLPPLALLLELPQAAGPTAEAMIATAPKRTRQRLMTVSQREVDSKLRHPVAWIDLG